MQIIGFDCVEGQVHSWESTSALERLGVLFETVANPSILSILSSLRPSLASRGIATLSNAESFQNGYVLASISRQHWTSKAASPTLQSWFPVLLV